MIYISLFLTSFLAATILPFSSEAALLAAMQTDADKFYLLVFASFGNVLAVVFNYFLGYFFSKKIRKKLYKSKTGKKAYRFSHKFGYIALLFSFLPIIGDPITLASGIFRLNFYIFLVVAASLRVFRYFVIYMIS